MGGKKRRIFIEGVRLSDRKAASFPQKISGDQGIENKEERGQNKKAREGGIKARTEERETYAFDRAQIAAVGTLSRKQRQYHLSGLKGRARRSQKKGGEKKRKTGSRRSGNRKSRKPTPLRGESQKGRRKRNRRGKRARLNLGEEGRIIGDWMPALHQKGAGGVSGGGRVRSTGQVNLLSTLAKSGASRDVETKS